MLRELSLFSGIGGFSLGLERAGYATPSSFIEIDPFCQRVLSKHWPGVPIHGDVTTREFIEGEADVITGGFPCQDVSCAGKRAGLSGSRSGLYRELVRAIRVVRPRVAIMENVAMLLSDGMGTVLGDLAEIRDCIEWDCVPACAIGAPHERERVFIVAHADMQRCGEARELRHRQDEMPSGGIEARPTPSDASDASREQVGPARQSWLNGSVESEWLDTNATRIGCGEVWARRPPDSFARVRDEARRNASDPYGARLAFCQRGSESAGGDNGRICQQSVQGDWHSIWPDEPALSRVDDVIPDWLDRVRATGNAILPRIAELIGEGLAAARQDMERAG
jgi:DNA (cytosine-5)-methyltransferase 1